MKPDGDLKESARVASPGLIDIIAIKASMNLGLSKELKTAFPDITPRHRYLYQKVKDPF